MSCQKGKLYKFFGPLFFKVFFLKLTHKREKIFANKNKLNLTLTYLRDIVSPVLWPEEFLQNRLASLVKVNLEETAIKHQGLSSVSKQ